MNIPTRHDAVCDGRSLLVAVHNGLDAVGVLHSRSQAGYGNTARVGGHVSWGLPTQTGSHSQLKNKCRDGASAGRRTEATGHMKVNVFPRNKKPEETFSSRERI